MRKLSKDGVSLIDHYILALDAIHLAGGHLVEIENEIKDFEYSKPVNIAHKDLEDIWFKLRDNLERMTGKEAIDFDKKFVWRIKNLEKK